MPLPSTNIVDAVSGEEVCPLCFDRYSAADECTCAVCSATSCPSCAEILDAEGAQRCFACRPARVPGNNVVVPSGTPLSLPRPIVLPAARSGEPESAGLGPLPLPFPLTTSPHGVRSLKPRPAGSVFVGLPPVSAQLSGSVYAAPASSKGASSATKSEPMLVHLSRRARAGLARGALFVNALAACVTHGKQLWRVCVARLPGVWRALELHVLRAYRALPEPSRLRPALARSPLRLQALAARAARSRAALRELYEASRPRLARAYEALRAVYDAQRVRLARVSAALVARLPQRQKTAIAPTDPSRPLRL